MSDQVALFQLSVDSRFTQPSDRAASPMDPRAPSRKSLSGASDLGRYAGLGVQFAASMALLGAAGWWLDGKLGTSPWLLITGVFAGAVGGFIAVIRAVPPSVHSARGASYRVEHEHEHEDERPPDS